MIGSIVGDIIGSPYEGKETDFLNKDFNLFNEKSTFTDDTVLTVATAMSILRGIPYKESYLELGKKYRDKGYGSSFKNWLDSENPIAYSSWGNGSAMRVSPIGLFYNDERIVLEEAEKSASVTHNHQDAIDGAKAVALSVYYAKIGMDKEEIKTSISNLFYYDFNKDVNYYHENYSFEIKCKETVIRSLIAFFESVDFESCIRNAVLIGGDTDTIACISGSIAESYYKFVPADIWIEAKKLIPDEFIKIITEFYKLMKV
jgi:ADP-ribosylglycohydrolase